MIKLEKTSVYGFEEAIRGMRNPMNSWDKSDSGICKGGDNCARPAIGNFDCRHTYDHSFQLGINDYDLMTKLRNAGTDHRKFMRMIMVYVDITAPLYWWKEFDTYKVGTVTNSCSTMHKIAEKLFTPEDFSCEHLDEDECCHKSVINIKGTNGSVMDEWNALDILKGTIGALNVWRYKYINTPIEKAEERRHCWWQMIQILPSSYNQKWTVMLNYEVLANIYKSRWNHKLDEWHTFCEWIEKLPYAELITDNKNIKTVNELRVEQGLPAVTDYEKYVNKLCDIGNVNAISSDNNKIGKILPIMERRTTMNNLNIPIEWKTRGCTVNGEPGCFHIWEHYSNPLPASPMIGEAPAGVFSKVFGIVEFADGVRRIEPTNIHFCDEENAYLTELKKHMEEKNG